MRTAHTHRQQTMFLGASCGEASPEERSETAAESRLPPLDEDEDEIYELDMGSMDDLPAME